MKFKALPQNETSEYKFSYENIIFGNIDCMENTWVIEKIANILNVRIFF